jgi:phosphate:Na+ symporter
MTIFNVIIAIFAAVVLFIFSLQGFSKEIQDLGSEKFKDWLGRITQNRIKGFFTGILITVLIQSSSALSSISVALVDAGVLTFFNSVPILIGANVGTTFTGLLIAFNLKNIGSVLLVIGFIVSIIPFRIKLAGKSIFYLGLILFSLEQLSYTLEPVQTHPSFIYWLSFSDNIFLGLITGAIVSALFQSSSLVTGLVVLLAQQAIIDLNLAIPIILGSNIGTTSTALVASVGLSENAKKLARANLLFNFTGVLLFIPLIGVFTNLISKFPFNLPYQIVTAHFIFNFVNAVIFLVFLKRIFGVFNPKNDMA